MSPNWEGGIDPADMPHPPDFVHVLVFCEAAAACTLVRNCGCSMRSANTCGRNAGPAELSRCEMGLLGSNVAWLRWRNEGEICALSVLKDKARQVRSLLSYQMRLDYMQAQSSDYETKHRPSQNSLHLMLGLRRRHHPLNTFSMDNSRYHDLETKSTLS